MAVRVVFSVCSPRAPAVGSVTRAPSCVPCGYHGRGVTPRVLVLVCSLQLVCALISSLLEPRVELASVHSRRVCSRERAMGPGKDAGYKVFFAIDWSQAFIQILEMTWYCCDKLWTLFTRHHRLSGRA